ncbi:MAG: chemotaxis-specific protein-glutamate methyltransferase CheB [Cyanobacteria bacterium J06560_5]
MPIRVLLVEDSPVALAVLTKILEQSPQIEIVGVAHTGVEALSMIPQVQPQVICTDLHMPHMDGLALTTEIMARFPLPILVISVSVQAEDTAQVFRLLEAGAVDVLPKPVAGMTVENEALNKRLIEKIQILSGVKVFKKKKAVGRAAVDQAVAAAMPVVGRAERSVPNQLSGISAEFSADLSSGMSSEMSRWKRPKIIAMGASTGGPKALHALLRDLPRNFPPIVCVQHISPGFLSGLLNWIQHDCVVKLVIAQEGQRPASGHVYFAPAHRHLRLNTKGEFTYWDGPLVDGHRPSITVTLQSVAHYYGPQSVGVLLTGMGQDGAAGMAAIARSGGLTLAQDESTSVVFGMPKVAIDLGAAYRVLPLDAIAPTLIEFVNTRALAEASRS